MHRLNTLFVGREFYNLPSVRSTNDHASSLLSKSDPPEGTVISTANQLAGRGQMGTYWESEPGCNLAISVILYPDFLPAKNQFLLNQAVALAIAGLVGQHFADTKIKWPNDIYVADKKIAGILIQNTISGNQLRSTVVGIGLNVNQTNFSKNTPNPTSFNLLSGNTFELDELIVQLCQLLEQRYLNLKAGKIDSLQKEYLNQLYRFGETNRYQRANGEVFQGKIVGISAYGKLQMQVASQLEEFNLKEVKFL